jgi:integrase
MVFTYMTGWRVGEPLALLREDLDVDAGTADTRYEDNKGRRDELVPLHPVVIDHLMRIRDFGKMVFTWPHHERTLWSDFARIQKAAGIHLPCRDRHEHTEACHFYGFHDLRRAFATQNAERLSTDALQALMRHKSYLTTQKYVNLARQVNRAIEALHVPEFLRKAN